MTILILLNPNHSGITELGPGRYAVAADGQPLQAEEVLLASGPDTATALRTAMYQLRVRRERELPAKSSNKGQVWLDTKAGPGVDS